LTLCHFLWIILFSIQGRAGFYENIMRVSHKTTKSLNFYSKILAIKNGRQIKFENKTIMEKSSSS
jgi:hypothetical protein